jgi:hypothetical protein
MQYRVLVRLANGSTVWVPLTANSIGQAQQLAQAQYERNRVLQVITAQ